MTIEFQHLLSDLQNFKIDHSTNYAKETLEYKRQGSQATIVYMKRIQYSSSYYSMIYIHPEFLEMSIDHANSCKSLLHHLDFANMA